MPEKVQLHFELDKQNLVRTDGEIIAAGSVNQIGFTLICPQGSFWWHSNDVYLVVKGNGIYRETAPYFSREQMYGPNEYRFAIPWEAIDEPGFTICLMQSNQVAPVYESLLYTNEVYIPVERGVNFFRFPILPDLPQDVRSARDLANTAVLEKKKNTQDTRVSRAEVSADLLDLETGCNNTIFDFVEWTTTATINHSEFAPGFVNSLAPNEPYVRETYLSHVRLDDYNVGHPIFWVDTSGIDPDAPFTYLGSWIQGTYVPGSAHTPYWYHLFKPNLNGNYTGTSTLQIHFLSLPLMMEDYPDESLHDEILAARGSYSTLKGALTAQTNAVQRDINGLAQRIRALEEGDL